MATAFLTSVKEEVTAQFAQAYDEIATELGDDMPDIVATTLQKLQKDTWVLMERKLKESFLNGKKATGAGTERKAGASHDTPVVSEPRSNPFRK